MTDHSNSRGGAAVGRIIDLPRTEAGAVLCLRLWFDGPDGQRQVWRDFSGCLGPSTGRGALRAFEQLCDLCLRHGRRPFLRHGTTCACLGADEACFAHLVAAASEGQHEDALMFASLMVRTDVAPILIGLAETFGLGLRRIALSEDSAGTDADAARTIH